ncbi:MAG: polyketide synthase, partial [Mycobacterium sp.]|nr:polyketide synthase [Mycobacterium sp.]
MPGVVFPDNAVAIVGVACRLPGGINSMDQLWTALVDGRDLVTSVPADRFDTTQVADTRGPRPGKTYTTAGGFLDDVSGFDSEYFDVISPREASRMDPQQRLLLEMVVEACDDAGIDPGSLAGSPTAVFVGASSHDYGDLQSADPRSVDSHTMTGIALANTANRLSHVFDLHGPSIATDTACSSGLTAVHQACEHLRSARTSGAMALAGGINVILNPYQYVGFSAASMLSPTGRSRPFSADADGFVRSEGGGVVLLKRLSDAVSAGDRIHAVILATGAGSDGRTAGLSLPSAAAQEALLRQVYTDAGVNPDDVAYLEAHGTGTPAGDPVESKAIGRALGQLRRSRLPVGSVKSNLGHLEAGSGLAGLLEAVLVLRHRTIPPLIHADTLNPAIDFDGLGLEPITSVRELTGPDSCVVGVN